MDNDLKPIKVIKKIIKTVRFRFENYDNNIYKLDEGNKYIRTIIEDGLPAAIVRLGSTEVHCAYPWMKNKTIQKSDLERGFYHAGIFPPDEVHNKEFAKIYLESIANVDVMALCGVYKEKIIINHYCPNATFIHAKSLEPYYFEEPWTYSLKNKNVLIIHPFVETIAKQYKVREQLFKNTQILPEFKSISFVKAVQSVAGTSTEFSSWSMALTHMCKEIDNKEFDVAIVGAGAYALPLCAYIKGIKKIAIQMSGATQILFGIKGKRWDNHQVVSQLYNENWVRPSIEETPKQIEKVEGGSYW